LNWVEKFSWEQMDYSPWRYELESPIYILSHSIDFTVPVHLVFILMSFKVHRQTKLLKPTLTDWLKISTIVCVRVRNFEKQPTKISLSKIFPSIFFFNSPKDFLKIPGFINPRWVLILIWQSILHFKYYISNISTWYYQA